MVLDLSWFEQHLLDEILPRWLEAAVDDSGLFYPRLDREWRRLPGAPPTHVSHSRLHYNFSVGYALTAAVRYREAVEGGVEALRRSFRDERHGGWFWSCAMDGSVVDEGKDTYGHAFVVFGLSHAARCLGSCECRDDAAATWETIRDRLSDSHGGFVPRTSRDFSEGHDVPVKSQNPIMHLFEALLALGDLEGMGHIYEDAGRIADFVFGRLVRSGDYALPELYTADWTELPAGDGGWINVGHQFEWAFLLSEAVVRGLHPLYLSHAENLIAYALSAGYDPQDGGVRTKVLADGTASAEDRMHRGWWEQCEATRALMHWALLRKRDELAGPLMRNIAFFREHLLDPEYGGWYRQANPSDLGKGDEWKLDYHVVGMCSEAIRLARKFGPKVAVAA